MKLGSLKSAHADGELLVVSRDLRRAAKATAIAPTMQLAIESWAQVAPQLQELYEQLNTNRLVAAFELDPRQLTAPLPRAYQWLDASAFHSHSDLLDQVFSTTPWPDKRTIPVMYQGAGDDFLGPHDDIELPNEDDQIDFEAEISVILDTVPMGTRAEQAFKHIKLLMLVNDVSLRRFVSREVRTGFGFIQAKPSSAFGPVAITPDELGDRWHDGRIHLPVHIHRNGYWFGSPNASQMGFGFHELVAHAALTRTLRAGTILGSGTISNDSYRTVGSACIAERRGIEILDHGQPLTPYLSFGQTVRIEAQDPTGQPLLGVIEQRVVPTARAAMAEKVTTLRR